MRSTLRSLGLLLAIASMISLTACGDGYVREQALPETGATLEGTVKYGKDDVQFAMVIVQTANGGTTANIMNGKYKLENVPLGEVMVGVNTNAGRGDYQTAIMGSVNKGPEAKGKGKTDIKFLEVPAKFADPTTSGIKFTVNKGSNTFNIEIPR